MSDNEKKVSTTKKASTTTKKAPAKKPAAKTNQGTKKVSSTSKTTTTKKKSTTTKKPVAKKATTTTKKAPVKKTGTATKKPVSKTGTKKPTSTTKSSTAKKPVAKTNQAVKKASVKKAVVPKVSESNKFSFNDDVETKVKPVASKKVKQPTKVTTKPTKKKKVRINFFAVTIALIFVVGVSFLAYVFIASSNDGPVYGDRCASAITLEQSVVDEFINLKLEDEKVQKLSIDVNCLTLKVAITFVDDITSDEGTEFATNLLKEFDVAIGKEIVEEKTYSELFDIFDVEFILQSSGDTDYPIFGTKHKSKESISYTGSNPANNETTNSIIEPEVEEEVETEDE